ncbi:magnesium chelatase, partial [Pseudomonas aeruginosa]|nr:magnesium chelatase [Pseudomonas aeruginosa]
ARRCFEAAVDGLRADLVWLRAARAHAAWRGGEWIEAEDIDAVEHFALLHRRRQSNPPPSAANPPPPPAAAPVALPERTGNGEGQWGELPARPVAM